MTNLTYCYFAPFCDILFLSTLAPRGRKDLCMALTPQEITDKQIANLKNAKGYIKKGVERLKEAPGKKAAEKADKMLAGITRAVQDGVWQERVAAVPLSEWQDSMNSKGIDRIGTGIEAARKKVEQFHVELSSFQATIAREMESLPDLTPEDRDTRMLYQTKRMREFRKSAKRAA